MSSARRYPWFTAALAAAALLAAGEGWCIYERATAARRALADLARQRAQLQAVADLVPAPTRENATAVEADLARVQRTLSAMQAELTGRGPAAERLRQATVPASRTDAFFDLATFVEKMRTLAKNQNVNIRPEAARLGFAAYTNEGPETDRVAAVFRQRLVAQYLIESLLEARPRALVVVQREPALTAAERAVRDAAAGGAPPDGPTAIVPPPPEGPDFFALDPRASARVPGYLDATGFRIVFTGETAALRTFLNKLAAFELPVLVREVEVDAASAEEVADSTPAEPAANPAASVVLTVPGAPRPVPTSKAAVEPIVPKQLCRFTVTVEFVELTTAASPAAPPVS
jgi:hypothetical protein